MRLIPNSVMRLNHPLNGFNLEFLLTNDEATSKIDRRLGEDVNCHCIALWNLLGYGLVLSMNMGKRAG